MTERRKRVREFLALGRNFIVDSIEKAPFQIDEATGESMRFYGWLYDCAVCAACQLPMEISIRNTVGRHHLVGSSVEETVSSVSKNQIVNVYKCHVTLIPARSHEIVVTDGKIRRVTWKVSRTRKCIVSLHIMM